MNYTGTELLWLLFIYSFLGWVLETAAAAVKQRKFVNRGLVNAPFCVLYGMAAVFITVFGAELDGIWLYIGSVIMTTLFEWIAGHLIERIYHERWWDYSGLRFNMEGYVSLPTSVFWGVLAFAMMKWGNSLFTVLLRLLPKLVGRILVWALFMLLVVDVAATLIVTSGKSVNLRRWESVDAGLSRYTGRIARWIYRRVNTRIERAYPETKKVEVSCEKTDVFAWGCGFYKLLWLFVIGAFLGDITETVFCRITAGVWMSRSSVVWGPFSIVWGLAIAAATLLLYRYRNRSEGFLFWTGTFLGGAYEYVCSVFTELAFGKVFWDYSKIPFNLGGRINLLYCFFWGMAAVVWIRYLYPRLSALIERIPMKPGKIFSWLLLVFMCCNITVSAMALARSEERANHIPAEHPWQEIMDQHYDDETMERIYPNMLTVHDE